ncbi:MAG: DUF4430 domain-containing protein [Lachnospiraceae bacterium]|nr:DUF4430 domain-containing protein [Lachnospiraceae bacterium]
MKMTKTKKHLSLCLCIVLIAATALFTNGCSDKQTTNSPEVTTEAATTTQDTEAAAQDTEATTQDTEASTSDTEASTSESTVLGEGETSFQFTVTDKDGNEEQFEIHTDKATVGEALLDLGLIEGEDGDYGLYVKTVNGITADYDVDGTYWAFYVDGEYATSGVDTTDITAGATYSFKVEK